ncbi:MAG: hypothetical protein JXR05_07540 [Flavobacteriaceae bacterium]
MKTKKDIGPVFKEALKNYESSPDISVWENIEASLKAEKKRRRIILIWFIGLLAILIPFFLIVGNIATPTNDSESIDIITKDQSNDNTKPIDSEKATPILVTKKEDINPSKDSSSKQPNPIKKNNKSSLISENFKKESIKNDTIMGNSLEDKNLNTLKKEKNIELIAKESDSTKSKKKKKKKRKLPIKKPIAKKQKNQQGWAWKIYPFASLDHYNAFKLKTSNQYTYNYGFRLNFYTINSAALRIGVKNLGLQYDFTSNGINNQQRVRYIEIPLEAKYLFTTDKFVNPSFIGGISYLYLQEATLTTPTGSHSNKGDFINNIISFNVGLGLQKDLSKNFTFTIEGFFKYQYRTYSKTVGFSPYTFSIHTGIEYHF